MYTNVRVSALLPHIFFLLNFHFRYHLFHQKVLQVKKSAVKISDEEMKNMQSREKEDARQELEHARKVAEALAQLPLFFPYLQKSWS